MKYHGFTRITALLLTLCLCLSLLPAAVFADRAAGAASEAAARDGGTEDASAQLGAYSEPTETAIAAEPDAAAQEPAQTAEETAPAEVEAEAEVAEKRVPTRAGTAANEGRTEPGQVLLTVDGTDYILIGTKQQLQALDYYPTRLTGNNADALTEAQRYDVMGPIWCLEQTRRNNSSPWETTSASLVYPGDADLQDNVAGQDFSGYLLYGQNDGIDDGNNGQDAGIHQGRKIGTQYDYDGSIGSDTRKYYVGGTLDAYDESITSYSYGKYSPRNNVVVFRDINLAGVAWEPLMFYGLMYGAKGSELDMTLESAVRKMRASEDYLDYTDDVLQPTISNVTVNTATGNLDPDKYVGVGFFASITSARPGSDSGLQHVKAEVRNLLLDNVRVTNNFTGIAIDNTVVNWLTGTLGSGVGLLLDGLLHVLTGKSGTDFRNSVSDLLTARAKDITNLATGGFVGRIYAEVLVENCDVNNAQVTGAGSYIGGFAGYSTGETQYDFVSNAAGALLNLLTTVLNIIPGLGLGDLISIVRNVLPLNMLVPVDYLNPHIEDCDVTDLRGNVGPVSQSWTFVDNSISINSTQTKDAECNGGFIGAKIATVMINCGVHNSDYTVNAKNYGGGFAGLARDAVIQELLTDLGVNLGVMQTLLKNLMNSDIDLQSVQVRCVITGSNVTVRGENYLGGFNGAMANAYCVNNEMQGQGKTLSVVGTGDCVGGFAGIATLGWAMSMGQGEAVGNTSLLSTLKNVLTSLLSSYGNELLSLLGVGQSEILGLQFDYSEALVNGSYVGNEATVEGHDYVGGLVGKADALIMTGTTGASLSKMTYFQNGDLTIWDIFPNMPKTGSYTVTYHEKNGSTTDVTVTANENFAVTLPSRSDDTANGYVFVGWITTHVDHSTAEPTNILYAGDTYVVTHDVTLNALYSKEGATAYELVTSTPDNWETAFDNYIITYGRDENMVVLTGLSGNTSYESASSGGAKTLSQIRAAHSADSFDLSTGLIQNVPDLYLFAADKMATQNDCYFENVDTETTLRRLTSGLAGHKGLSSYNVHADVSTQWHPFVQDNLTVAFESDYGTGDDKYIVYDTNGYFKMDTLARVSNMYIWGKTKLPTRYTTVDPGVPTPDVDVNITIDNSVVGRFAQIHVNGLRLVNGHKFVGGIAGLAGTANVSGLLNDTIGVGDFKKFEFNDIIVVGGTPYQDGSGNDGLKVWGRKPDSLSSDTGAGYYVGGGVGLAMGGDLLRIDISRLNMVEGTNCVGGFAGCVGPGELLGTGGLNLQLLGLSLLSANNLLSVGQGIETQIQHVTVTGIPVGYTVEATGTNAQGETYVFCAGGFFGRSNSTVANDCHAVKVQWVKANNTDGRAGGFLGVSEVGGLASLDDAEGTQIQSLISAGKLLDAVGYLIPEYTAVDTTYVDGGYVAAAWAGGFAADLQSGLIDNLSKDPLGQNQSPEDKADPDWYAVYNIDHVTGTRYAGGFGARVVSGALADAGGGISILGNIDGLSINLTDLLSLVNAYVPTIRYAGVKSDRSTRTDKTTGFSGSYDPNAEWQQGGFTVECTGCDADDKTTGAAGGFLGYASGVQVSYCDVRQLLHTTVTPPAALDGTDGSSYFGNQSSYAVTGTRYAGGYAGYLDVGSAASLGGGLKALNVLNLNNILAALDCVISTVEHSDVHGGPGGFAVLATRDEAAAGEAAKLSGRAGGFVGWMRGAHIQDSHSWNFSYIIGRIAAGGYVAEMEPGSVADALGDTSVLNGLLSVSGSLLSVAQDFVPTIRNSVTTCIPCGGAVRADAASTAEAQRGMAGGYAGHNLGGHVWGNNDEPWRDENVEISQELRYSGPQSECAAIRILSVYGTEYAGGFTGLMDAGSTADTGNISLLFNLVKLDNLLGALKVSYPTEENTAVYGPLSAPMVGTQPSLTYTTWNTWVDYIGVYGGYGLGMPKATNQTNLYAIIDDYSYGYHVTAGRDSFVNTAATVSAGCAGGYVGAMRSGTVTNGQAHDCKQVRAMRNAGGFAGELRTGAVVNLGQAEALGLQLDLSQLLTGAVDVLVPVVKTSSVHGYQNGMTVAATGDPDDGCGNAGGFAGTARGAQIWGDDTGSDNPGDGCNVLNLKKVQGTRYAGGYFGNLGSGTTAEAGTNVSEGPLQDLLDAVVKSGADNASALLSVLNATVSTVRAARITTADPAWGFTVEGYADDVPLCAGGFVGAMEGAIVGNNKDQNLNTTNIEVNNLRGVEAQYYAGGFFGAANVGGAASVAGNGANLLSLARLGNISALDVFRPYIFNSVVNGVADGLTVRTTGAEKVGTMNSTRYSGCAGGFGGALLSGQVSNSKVTRLSEVSGKNYVGGFVGHCGKSGLVDADSASVLEQINLLGAQAGVGDAIGSRIFSSAVESVDASQGCFVRATGGSEPVAGGFVGYADLAKIGFTPAIGEDTPYPCSVDGLAVVSSDQIAGGFVGKTTKGYLVEAQASSVLLEGLLDLVNALLELLYLDRLQDLDGIRLNILGQVLSVSLLDGNLLGVTLLGVPIKVGLARASETGASTDVAKVTIGDSYVELPCNQNGVIVNNEQPNLNISLFPLFYSKIYNSTVRGVGKGFDVFGGGAEQDSDGNHANGYTGGFAGYNYLGEIGDCATELCDAVRGTANKVGPFTGFYDNDSNYSANNQSAKETDDSYNGKTHVPGSPDSADFASSAKVLLMDDAAPAQPLQSLVPETAEMQDPCAKTVDLTLHKVWDDLNGLLGLRAGSGSVTVTFRVWQVTNGDTAHAVQVGQDIVLSAADANAWTDAVWTRKITGLPATNRASDPTVLATDPDFERYSYYVTETVSDPSGYTVTTAYADADVSDKLSFDATAEDGYVAKITNEIDLTLPDQTVVVDFGLKQQISVVGYVRAKNPNLPAEAELKAILPATELANVNVYGTAYWADGDNARLVREVAADTLYGIRQENAPRLVEQLQEGQSSLYGQFDVPAGENVTPTSKLNYLPGSMRFDKPVEVAALIELFGYSFYTRVIVVPAATIYYENDYISFTDGSVSYAAGEGGETPASTAIAWNSVGSASAEAAQAEDRPGSDVFDGNNVYGYDPEYSNSTEYSLGETMRVTVGKPADNAESVTWPTASFTFTGSGFDLISVTDRTTGFMRVVVDGETADGTPVHKNWTVDTFFGCTRSQNGYVRYLMRYVVEEQDGQSVGHWTAVKKVFPAMTDQTVPKPYEDGNGVQSIDADGNYLDQNGTPITDADGYRVRGVFPDESDAGTADECYVVYRRNYEWTTDASGNGQTLYQIPVVSSEEQLSYGTYTVTLTPMYAPFFDRNKADGDDSYTLYVDAVRVYRPALELDETYYAQDHEGWPQFIQMRNLLLTQQAFSSIEGTVPGVVFMDAVGDAGTITDYEPIGPNNEIYLRPNQAVAFALQSVDRENIDRVHVSLKKVCGAGAGEAVFTNGEQTLATVNLNTAAERYYDITSAINWDSENRSGVIVVRNNQQSGDVILSMRNLKVTYKTEPASGETVQVVVDPGAGRRAKQILHGMTPLPVVLDEDADFYGANLTLGSDLTLHFYVPEDVLAEAENAYVVFTRRDADGAHVESCFDYTPVKVDGVVCRRYSYPGISAKQMGDEIEARLFFTVDGEERMSPERPYSVLRYAEELLDWTDAPALRTLAVDLLNYGAQAQRYFDYAAAAPVNAGLTAEQLSWGTQDAPTLADHLAVQTVAGATVDYYGTSLSLNERVTINYYLDLSGCADAADALCLELSWTDAGGVDRTAVIDGAAFVARNGCVLAAFDGLSAAQMRTVVHARVLRKSDGACLSDLADYSIVSYVSSVGRTDPDSPLYAMLLAMLRYGDAASRYFSES